MRVLCGTSGYNYDAWKGRFYPSDLAAAKMLGYYAGRFPTVEINYTFYRKPTEKALEGWARQTPAGFRFALKAWQRITHQKRLRDCTDLVTVFCATARTLGDKLGPMLVQLPPNLKKDVPLLDEFLAAWPKDLRAAFEFRHRTWFDDAVFSSLRSAGAALCIADQEEFETPLERTAPWGYFRLRRVEYDAAALDGWAQRLLGAGFTDDVSVYFKHEDEAKGPELAAAFAARVDGANR
jgi:uncharacterized protein YecE (DUF72 family)